RNWTLNVNPATVLGQSTNAGTLASDVSRIRGVTYTDIAATVTPGLVLAATIPVGIAVNITAFIVVIPLFQSSVSVAVVGPILADVERIGRHQLAQRGVVVASVEFLPH